MGLVPLQRDPRELPHPFCQVRTEHTAVCELGSRTSPDTESAGALTLDFQPSEQGECLLFTSHPVCGIQLQRPKRTKTEVLSSFLALDRKQSVLTELTGPRFGCGAQGVHPPSSGQPLRVLPQPCSDHTVQPACPDTSSSVSNYVGPC